MYVKQPFGFAMQKLCCANGAERAAGMRLADLWVISMRLPLPPAKMTWSPTTSLPRRVAKPIVLFCVSPVCPSWHTRRGRRAACPAPGDHFAKLEGVPDGASTFMR